MTATCIYLEETKATVVLRPCWLARLLGARTFYVEIKRYGDRWWTTNAGNLLSRSLERDKLILGALDFRPVSQLPEARVL